MPAFHHIDSWIEVDSERADEYDVAIDDKMGDVPSVSCWIPSTAGKPFSVHWRDDNLPRNTMQAALHADGALVRNGIFLPSYGPHAQPSNSATMRFISTPDGRREIEFTDIERTDDGSVLGSSNHVSLGEITLQLTPAVVVSRTERGTQTAAQLHVGKVHERSKKVGVHVVRAGKRINVAAGETFSHRAIGPPFVKFIFRYRPLALLQANGIVPPFTPARFSPSPSPPPIQCAPSPGVEVKDEDEHENELGFESPDDKIRRLQAEIDRIRNGKRRRSNSVIFKSEPSSQRIKVLGNNDVIDLTLDNSD